MWVGLGCIAWSGIGILISNSAEKSFGMVPTEEDKERLRKAMPKITVVERREREK